MTLQHPQGGTILPIQDDAAKVKHVLKHLYSRKERWHLIGGLNLPPFYAADKERTLAPYTFQKISDSPYTAPEHLVASILDDHDNVYRVAYEGSLQSALESNTYGTWTDDERQQEAFVGRNGVFTIIHKYRKQDHQVATAFRVVPEGAKEPSKLTNKQYWKSAVQHLRDTTSYR